MSESREIRLKRLQMRSMRRGIKEMDIILSSFANTQLASMDDSELDHYETLMEEADLDLYQWVSGQAPTPPQFLDLVTRISANMRVG
jgi:antitoxin CptB